MTETLPEQEIRRSFALNVANGALFNFAERLIDPPVILPRFVSNYTSSNLLIGLAGPLGTAGWLLPQIFVSTRVQRMPLKKPAYIFAAIVRTFAWLALSATVWVIVDSPALVLASFFGLYGLARLVSGIAGLSFFDITAKTVPARRRGSMFSLRQFIGGILGLGAGWIVSTVLNLPNVSPQRGHAILFSAYCVVMIPALAAFIMVREPPGAIVPKPVNLQGQLRRAGGFLRQDVSYRRYLLTRLSLGLAGMALPFYAVFAKEVLSAPARMGGLYVTTSVGAQMLANLLWGRLSDRLGNRLVMRLHSVGKGLSLALALILLSLTSRDGLSLQVAYWPYLALPLYAIEGAVRPAEMLTGSNFLLELAPTEERPLYLGLSNTLMGVVVLLSGFGGIVVDISGYGGIYVLSLALCLAGYLLATGLPEPRRDIE